MTRNDNQGSAVKISIPKPPQPTLSTIVRPRHAGRMGAERTKPAQDALTNAGALRFEWSIAEHDLPPRYHFGAYSALNAGVEDERPCRSFPSLAASLDDGNDVKGVFLVV